MQLHEAIGHRLEGDFNRKGSSAISGGICERDAQLAVSEDLEAASLSMSTTLSGRALVACRWEGVRPFGRRKALLAGRWTFCYPARCRTFRLMASLD